MTTLTRIARIWATRLQNAAPGAATPSPLTRGLVQQLTHMLHGYGKRTALTEAEMVALDEQVREQFARGGYDVTPEMKERATQLLRRVPRSKRWTALEQVLDALPQGATLDFRLVGFDTRRTYTPWRTDALPVYEARCGEHTVRYSCAPRQWAMNGYTGDLLQRAD
jgi:hypothetical protein